MKNLISRSLLLFGVVVIVFVLYRVVDPLDAVWMPKCFSYTWFGVQCPGCGTQRALHALFMGDFRAAFLFNPLLILSIPYFGCVLLFETKSFREKYPRLHDLLLGQRAIWVLLAVLFIYTLIRNYFEF